MAGEIVVRGKGSGRDRLPLPVDVGEAIVDYLHAGDRRMRGAGRCSCESVPTPPVDPGRGDRGRDRSGAAMWVGKVTAHRLRHSIAVDLLRSGAGLTEIGQLLRHLARADHVDLREG